MCMSVTQFTRAISLATFIKRKTKNKCKQCIRHSQLKIDWLLCVYCVWCVLCISFEASIHNINKRNVLCIIEQHKKGTPTIWYVRYVCHHCNAIFISAAVKIIHTYIYLLLYRNMWIGVPGYFFSSSLVAVCTLS